MTKPHEKCSIVELSDTCRATRDIMKPTMYGIIVANRELFDINVHIYRIMISDGSLISIFDDDFRVIK